MKRSNVSVAACLCVYVTLSGAQEKESEEVAFQLDIVDCACISQHLGVKEFEASLGNRRFYLNNKGKMKGNKQETPK